MDIREWVEENKNSGINLSNEDIDHVTMCLEHIHRWYYEDYPLGGFLTSVVRNDLVEAACRADDVNRRALKLYALFLIWNLPGDWRKKASSI